MNIIFLDIDGVLNSVDSIIGLGMSYPKDNPADVKLDPVRVGLLKYVYSQIDDVGIYVHSSWAKFDHVDAGYIGDILMFHDFKDANILPINKDSARLSRVDRIQRGIDELKPDKFIIYDDVDMTNKFGNSFSLVNRVFGLSEVNLLDAKFIFDISVPIVLL